MALRGMHDNPGPLILFSKTGRSIPADAATAEEKVLDRLISGVGASVWVTPELLDLPDQDPFWEQLTGADQPFAVISRLHPRAVRALLVERNVLPEAEKRFLGAYRLQADTAPEVLIEAIPGIVPVGQGGAVVRTDARHLRKRWYPLIDRERCTRCGQCHEFCVFGVFERTAAGEVIIVRPDNCKPGCPACARVCPAGAVIFPDCPDDDLIAGADGPVRAAEPASAVSCACACTCSARDRSTAQDVADLDDLIAALDALDDA